MGDYQLYCGDCLDILPTLADGCADAIITDLPYGTTACKWDEVIPFAPMWEQVKRLLKKRGAFVTTASQPFTSALVMSNPKWLKWEDVWKKNRGVGHLNAKRMPMRAHETILVFGQGEITYNPQMRHGEPYKRLDCSKNSLNKGAYGKTMDSYSTINTTGERYPTSVIEFGVVERTDHPTQKPVALYEYLIRTYTNAGDVVLDFCFGSGTTGVAAIQTGRKFIGIERERKYYKIAEKRIAQAQAPLFVDAPLALQAELA